MGLNGRTDASTNPHPGNESNHYYRQTTAPISVEAAGSDPLQIGDIWSDTTANLLKRCTGINPDTFTSTEGGGGLTFAVPTGDIDIGDTAAEGVAVTGVRSDHQHTFTAPGAGYPLNVAAAESDGTATTPARSDHVHAHGSGFLPNAHHNQDHGSSDHSGATLPGEANEDFGAFFVEIDEIAAPGNPAAATRRIFVNSADGKLSVRTSAGANVSLEEQGGGVTFAVPTGDVDIGDAAVEGVLTTGVRADHQHAFPAPGAGYPLDVAAAESDGTASTPARSDHVHAHGTGFLPDAHHARSHDHSNASDGSTLTPAILNIPSSATPAQTADGQMVWDSDDDLITVGDGVARKTFFPIIDATSDPLIDGSVADGTEATAARKDHVHPFHHAQAHAAAHADGGADELAVQDLASDAAIDGQVAKADGAGAVAFEDDEAGVSFIIDGGGSTITTGIKGDVEMPYAGTITAVRLFADQSGAVVVDIWKDTFANFPPTIADTITASAKPTIVASGVKDEDTTLTGWIITFAKGDILRYNVDSASSIQRLTVSLNVDKT